MLIRDHSFKVVCACNHLVNSDEQDLNLRVQKNSDSSDTGLHFSEL